MKNKRNTVWYAIKQGFLIVFVLIMVFLSFGFILLAIFFSLDDEDEEPYDYNNYCQIKEKML